MGLGATRRVAAAEGAWQQALGGDGAAPSSGELVVGELRFGDGATYSGPLVDGVASGGRDRTAGHGREHERERAVPHGTLRTTGWLYEGGFARGLFDGLGTRRSVAGVGAAIESGQFAAGVLAGRATTARARLVCAYGGTLVELLQHADAACAAPGGSLLGPYFETPRPVLVVELVHGTWARGRLQGAGTRLLSVCLVQRHADLGALGAAAVFGRGGGGCGGDPGDDDAGARVVHAGARARTPGDAAADAWRRGLAAELDAMCRRWDTQQQQQQQQQATPAGQSAAAHDRDRDHAVTMAGRAIGVVEWLAQLGGGGHEVLRVCEHGTWALASEQRGATAWAVASAPGSAGAGVAATAAAAVDLLTGHDQDAAAATAAPALPGGRAVPVLQGAACAATLTWRPLDAAGGRLETRTHAYAGAYAGGVPHGSGTLVVRTEAVVSVSVAGGHAVTVHDVYEGELACGQPHGRGTLTTLAGGRYDGLFAGGVRCGQGTARRASGLVVSGVRDAQGRKHGAVTYAWPGGGRRVVYDYEHGRRVGWGGADPDSARRSLVHMLPTRLAKTLLRVLPAPARLRAPGPPPTPTPAQARDTDEAAASAPTSGPVSGPASASAPSRLAQAISRVAEGAADMALSAVACAPLAWSRAAEEEAEEAMATATATTTTGGYAHGGLPRAPVPAHDTQ